MNLAKAQAMAKTERAKFLTQNLDIKAATGIATAEWEYFQLDFLNDENMFRCDVKSRQIGCSFTYACEAVAECLLEEDITSIFVSKDEDDAMEKIRYSRRILECLPPIFQFPLIVDNKSSIEFFNHSRIISHPSKPIRGKPKVRIYLDEFAHYQHDEAIYQSAVPAIIKGSGRIRVASTPLGALGTFYNIATDTSRYSGYSRLLTPWYATEAMCINTAKAAEAVNEMDMASLVMMFGTDRLKAIYPSLTEDEFLCEFCAVFIDESVSFIPLEEIVPCMADEREQYTCYTARAKGSDTFAVHEAIDRLANDIRDSLIPPVVYWGMDIGRHRDTTEIIGLVEDPADGSLSMRLSLTLDQVEYDTQEAVVNRLLDEVQGRGTIDATGLGGPIAESLERTHRVLGLPFTNNNKEMMAVSVKKNLQNRRLSLPFDRDLKNQIHSLRRLITPAKNVVFDVPRTKQHHGDRLWALGLALISCGQKTYYMPPTFLRGGTAKLPPILSASTPRPTGPPVVIEQEVKPTDPTLLRISKFFARPNRK